MSIRKRVKAERNSYKPIWKLSSVASKALMNKKLEIAFRRRSSEQGFAMPVAVGMGFIMILIAAMMIMRSQGDQVTASAQKGAAQSLAVTEGGVTRSLSTLNQSDNAFLLRLNYDPINTATTTKTYLGPDGILNNGDEENAAVNQWSNPPNPPPCSSPISLLSGLVSGSMGSGNYQIKAYRYLNPDGVPNNGDEGGTLLIEGYQGISVSRVQVSMRVVQRPQINSFAGLYASSLINLGNNDVLSASGSQGLAANVICKDCTVNQCSGNNPTQAGLNSAVGRGPNSDIDGKIFIGDPQLPPVPTASNTTCSVTTLVSGQACSITLSSNELTPGNAGKILPRVADLATHQPGTPFHYKVSSMDFSGGQGKLTVYTATNTTSLTANAASVASSINVASVNGFGVNDKLSVGSDPSLYTISAISGNTLTITPALGTAQPQGAVVAKPTDTTYNPHGDPVYLYVSGGISFGGSASMVHSGTPNLLRIYGNPADPTNSTNDQQFTLNGGASTSNVFIYAPDATMGINGGSSDPDIQGAVWVKTWDGSSSNNAEIRVPDNMPTLLGGLFSGVGMQTYKSSVPTSWQRQPVSTQ